MYDLSFEKVVREIKCWHEHRHSFDTLKNLFSGVHGFQFSVSPRQLTTGIPGDLHVYPAIRETDEGKQLKFYTIPANYDTEFQFRQLKEKLVSYISETEIILDISRTALPPGIAVERIELWRNKFSEWLKEAIDESLVFQAFRLPGNDLQLNIVDAYFGLMALTEQQALSMRADLVLSTGISSTEKSFEDTVMPVPPFGPGSLAISHFFLLEHSREA